MRPHCAFCCQHKGWIVYGWEHTAESPHVQGRPIDCPGCVEVYAPCPFCEDGRAVEISVYGDRGYWHGDAPTPAQVQETCRCHERPLRGAAGRQRLDEIMAMLNGHLGDRDKRKKEKVAEQLERAKISQALSSPEPAKDTAVSTGPVDDDEIGVL